MGYYKELNETEIGQLKVEEFDCAGASIGNFEPVAGTSPKSEWFGFKYRVNPESSKLLQEAVITDGGGWGNAFGKDIRKGCTHIFVQSNGVMTYLSDGDEEYFIENSGLPEKQPPQPASKDFVVGKYYKYILQGLGVFKTGKYYKLSKASGGLLFSEDMYRYMRHEAFDITSESDYDPNTGHPTVYTSYVVFKQEFSGVYDGKEYAYKCSREDYMQWVEYRAFDEDVFAEVNVSGVEKKVKVLRIETKVDPKATKSIVRILPNSVDMGVEGSKIKTYQAQDVKIVVSGYELQRFQPNDFFSRDDVNLVIKHFNQQEEIDMSQVTRKVLNFKLIDADSALPVEFSLVHDFGDVVVEDDVETVKQQLLGDNDLKEILKKHNAKRIQHVNLEIQQKTGNTVKLLPLAKVKELTWSVK